MRKLDNQQFDHILGSVHMKPRFKRELKFASSVGGVTEDDWSRLELFPIWNKSGRGGVLFLQPDRELYIVPFELGDVRTDAAGRSKPVVCDLCYTWQASGMAGYVTFYPDAKSNNSTSFLCCYDLRCSDHVRGKSAASIKSRVQLRENLDDEDRVERLRQKIGGLVTHLKLSALP